MKNIVLLIIIFGIINFCSNIILGTIFTVYQYDQFRDTIKNPQLIIALINTVGGITIIVFVGIFVRLKNSYNLKNLEIVRMSAFAMIFAVSFQLAGVLITSPQISIVLYVVAAFFWGLYLSLGFGILNLFSDSIYAQDMLFWQDIRFCVSTFTYLLSVLLNILVQSFNDPSVGWETGSILPVLLVGFALSYLATIVFCGLKNADRKTNTVSVHEDKYANNYICVYLIFSNYFSNVAYGWKMFFAIFFIFREYSAIQYQYFFLIGSFVDLFMLFVFRMLTYSATPNAKYRIFLGYKLASLVMFLLFIVLDYNLVYLLANLSLESATSSYVETIFQNHCVVEYREIFQACSIFNSFVMIVSSLAYATIIENYGYQTCFYTSFAFLSCSFVMLLRGLFYNFR